MSYSRASRLTSRRLFLSSRGDLRSIRRAQSPSSMSSNNNWSSLWLQHPPTTASLHATTIRQFFGGFSKFDPLGQTSATVLKQPDEELSEPELALKQALQEYKTHQQGSMDEAEEYQLLEELQQAYMELGYWTEALGVEEIKCSDLEEGTDDHADSIHAQGKLYLRQQDFKNSKLLYDQALEFFTQSKNHIQKGHVLISLAGWYYFQNQLDKAMEHLITAEPLLDKNPSLLVKCLDNQGLVQRLWGDYHSALDKYQQALQVVVDEETRQALLLHVGDMHLALEEPQEALTIFQELVLTIKDKGIEGVLWHNIATIHVDQGEFDFALDEFHKALQLKQETGGENHPEVAKTLNSLGVLHAGALHQYPKARECFQQALIIARINAADPSTDPDVNNLLQNISHIEQQLNR